MKNKVGNKNTKSEGKVDIDLREIKTWQKSTNKKFDKIDTWQKKADKKFTKIDTWQKSADKKFTKIDTWQKKADKKFTKIDERFDGIEEQLSKVSLMATDNAQDIKWIKQNMATKQDLTEMGDRLMGAFEKFYKSNKNTEQEQVFMGSRIKRIESDVEKIKPLVGLA